MMSKIKKRNIYLYENIYCNFANINLLQLCKYIFIAKRKKIFIVYIGGGKKFTIWIMMIMKNYFFKI